MAKFADVAYKSVTASLGLATLWVGGNLVFNITRGISWHYAQEKTAGEVEASQKSWTSIDMIRTVSISWRIVGDGTSCQSWDHKRLFVALFKEELFYFQRDIYIYIYICGAQVPQYANTFWVIVPPTVHTYQYTFLLTSSAIDHRPTRFSKVTSVLNKKLLCGLLWCKFLIAMLPLLPV